MLKHDTHIGTWGASRIFLIPHGLKTDGAFPFKDSDELIMAIEEGKVIISRKK